MPTPQRISAYALIIAVSGHGLDAPESDAYRLRNTLIQFGFPGDQVELLLGTKATRRAIIDHLRKISTDPTIKKNSPILIYFAGHGARQWLPVPGLGKIHAECILPHDTLATHGRIPPIPDITISALLGEISKAKGDYITLLLDCCHSGSGSRDSGIDNKHDSPFENLNFDPDILVNEDGAIWSEFLKANSEVDTGHNSRSISTSNPGSFRYQGIKSHVLIASCRESEKSFEFSRANQPPTGLFTASLIEALEDCRISKMKWEVTYVGLFNRIKDFMQDLGQGQFPQTPQCEGYHRDRYVFATPLFPHRNHAISPIMEITGRPGQYLLPVGELAGARAESEFEIWDYRKGQPFCKGRFRVSGVDTHGGSMTNINSMQDLKLSPDAYAVLCVLPTPLPIDLSPELHQIWNSQEFQTDLTRRLNASYSLDHFITLAQPGYPSRLRISRNTSMGGVKIEHTNGRSHPIILQNPSIPFLSDTLAKAVMFYYHLETHVISRDRNPLVFQALALIELAPNDPNYLGTLAEDKRQRPITFRPNEETLVHHSDGVFGLRVENHANLKEALYIYIFYFNPNDFSITPIYLPPSDQPSVMPRGLLQIGYGNSGAAPLTFTNDGSMYADPGFFKIYYSISPSEMSTIQQDGVEPNQSAVSRAEPHYQPSTPSFGALLYPMAVLTPHARH